MPKDCKLTISDGAAKFLADQALRSGLGARALESGLALAAARALSAARRDATVSTISIILRGNLLAIREKKGEEKLPTRAIDFARYLLSLVLIMRANIVLLV